MPVANKIPKEDADTIIEQWKNGMTASSAASKLGYHGSTGISVVREYILKGKLDTKAHARILKTVDKGKIGALYKAGWSYYQIAEEMFVNEWTVKYVLKKEGLIDE